MAKTKSSTPAAITFTQRANRPDALVAEAEIVFADTLPLVGGMKLTGFAIWKSGKDGSLFVSLPSKQGRKGTEVKYFDFLRPAKGGNGTSKALREEILRQWLELQGEASA